ncbi:MFS transporter [Streptomyces prunicolor]|uniref:MFS transporter n=1 Tax=Streptomyces prunicolor TaxID=67348 RepID=UPI0022553A26|nr:MFS transporter [Streptomyces prunicolor]MCX5241923.1 MFS transporter [Streptomyces prunicolor]
MPTSPKPLTEEVTAPQASPAVAVADADAPDRRRWWVLIVIAIAQLMVVLDVTIVNIAMPSAQRDLGFSDGNRQWIVTAYALAFGSLLLLGGRLADLFGRKIAFLVGIAGFAGSSALAGAAPSFEVLVTGRVLQGLFGALLAPAALAVLNVTFTTAKDRARAFGVFGAIGGAGGAFGLLLGGLLTEHLSWRWTLYVNLVFAVFAFAGGLALMRKGAPAVRPGLDLPGTVLGSAGLFGLVYGFANAETYDWSSPMTWGTLTAAVLLLTGFAWWQTRTPHPLLPLRVLADRTRGASFLVMAIASAGLFGVSLFLTYYLQSSRGFTPVRTGLAFLPMMGGLMVVAQLSISVLLPKIGPKILVPLGLLTSAAGLALLTALDLNSGYAAGVLPGLLLIGSGIGLSLPPAMSLSIHGVGVEDAGVASAAVNTMQQVGGAIGTALLNTLAASAATAYLAGRSSTPATVAQAQLHSYSTAYWWSAGLFVTGAVIAALTFHQGSPGSGEPSAPLVHM